MRCKFCGSKSLHNDSAHQTFSTGKAVAGAITFGVVGAAAGFIGKERQGYRCGACGAFMDTPMDLLTENLVDNAIRQAELGKSQKMYSYYKSQYPNIQANIPVSLPETAARTEEIYKELPVPPIQDGKSEENVKYKYHLNVWHPDCPVYVDEIIIKTRKDGDSLSLIAFNQAEAQLRSAYFNVEIFDDTGDKIGETKCVYQNLNLKTGEKLPDNKEFPLNTDIAYRVDIKCEKAAMVGDEVWRNEDMADPVFLTEQAVLEENHFPRLKYVRASLPKYSKMDQSSTLYLPEDHEEYWQCICGHAVIKGKVCPYCGSKGVECLEELLSQKRLEEMQQTAVKERAAKRAEITYPLYEKEYNKKMEGIYSKAASLLSSDTEPDVREAANIFRSIEEYKDSSERARQCEERIPALHNDNIYDSAIKLMAEDSTEKYESAIEKFQSIPDWKDSKEYINICREKIEKLKQKEEEARLEAERLAEEKRIAEEQARKKRKRTLSIVIPLAVAAFIALIVFTTVIIPNNRYNKAVALMESGNYEAAIPAFDALNGYKDSGGKIDECKIAILDQKYDSAVALMESGKYESAISAFEALDGYKSSKNEIENCKLAILENQYNNAINLIESGNIVEGYESLLKLNGYKDSAGLLANTYELYKLEKLKTANIGDYVYFGRYEQDNSTSNGKETIEWLVLDRKRDSLFILSRYGLEGKQFDNSLFTSWKECSLREWLNGDFANSAFSDDEETLILNNTDDDKISLLSIEEADKHFSSDKARKCFPTDYAFEHWSERKFYGDNVSSEPWWLKTRGSKASNTACVWSDGKVWKDGVEAENDYLFVRPAIWIDLSLIN